MEVLDSSQDIRQQLWQQRHELSMEMDYSSSESSQEDDTDVRLIIQVALALVYGTSLWHYSLLSSTSFAVKVQNVFGTRLCYLKSPKIQKKCYRKNCVHNYLACHKS